MMLDEINIKEKGDIMGKEELLARMAKAVIEGNKEEAVALAEQAIAEKMDLNEVIERGICPRDSSRRQAVGGG